MNTLYLIRHSLTDANEKHLYCGSTDIGLSESGLRLAEKARSEHSWPECALYVTSGMKRAEETLNALYGCVPRTVCPALRETDFGDFELKSYDMLKDDPEYISWILDTAGTVAPPHGESRAQADMRIAEGMTELFRRKERDALAVCHGGTVAVIMRRCFPEAGKTFYDWQPGACAGWRIDLTDGIPTGFASFPEHS